MRHLLIYSFIFLLSCHNSGIRQYNSNLKSEPVTKSNVASNKTYGLTNKSIKFLWRANKYNEQLKGTFNTIIINEEFCRTISEPERAALGYVATFVGNECNWDGKAKDDLSNLKCKIISALNLGYQCSERHLGFLRNWFRNDNGALEKLKECPQVPYTATIQDTFDQINLNTIGDTIKVWYKASGVNSRSSESWNWTEEDIFILYKDNLKIFRESKSEIKRN
jgi:hypothetical protein